MDKKYQVFISSTYKDLVIERQEVVEAVLNAGHIPAGMELFKAGPTQEEIIREWIEESDIYVLILGPRYGSVNDDGISYTQWEYNLAKELNKPMFSIVLDAEYMNSMVPDRIKAIEFEVNNPKYQEFHSEVMTALVAPINHIAEIRGRVSDSIRDIERRYPEKLEGWIKGSYVNELEELRKKNKNLLEKLTSRQEEVIDMKEEISKVRDNYIGSFDFSYVKDKMMRALFDEEIFYNRIAGTTRALERAVESDNYPKKESDIKKYRALLDRYKRENTVFAWLKNNQVKISNGTCRLKRIDGDPVIRYEVLPFLERYQLAYLEDIPSRDLTRKSTSQKIKFTDIGHKFISMLEMEEEQTK